MREEAPDIYGAWERRERETEDALHRLPVCSICGERIQGEYCYRIDGGRVCESCLVEYFREETADYLER